MYAVSLFVIAHNNAYGMCCGLRVWAFLCFIHGLRVVCMSCGVCVVFYHGTHTACRMLICLCGFPSLLYVSCVRVPCVLFYVCSCFCVTCDDSDVFVRRLRLLGIRYMRKARVAFSSFGLCVGLHVFYCCSVTHNARAVCVLLCVFFFHATHTHTTYM